MDLSGFTFVQQWGYRKEGLHGACMAFRETGQNEYKSHNEIATEMTSDVVENRDFCQILFVMIDIVGGGFRSFVAFRNEAWNTVVSGARPKGFLAGVRSAHVHFHSFRSMCMGFTRISDTCEEWNCAQASNVAAKRIFGTHIKEKRCFIGAIKRGVAAYGRGSLEAEKERSLTRQRVESRERDIVGPGFTACRRATKSTALARCVRSSRDNKSRCSGSTMSRNSLRALLRFPLFLSFCEESDVGGLFVEPKRPATQTFAQTNRGNDLTILNEAERRERSCKNARVTSHWAQIDLITERKRLARTSHLVGAFGALPAFCKSSSIHRFL
ncbi:hypothetical protein ALC56_07453 [Trachymyrmex septentrionalis]|uniref:Uncharacterized protein n=1 Tax=Trachymyrmex septentrionalis TaxID=34720 RepID=A0A195FDY3_9HYME|nr:hypothetical protein ALC56_07453 [Trachymyrmex septentrionalis]